MRTPTERLRWLAPKLGTPLEGWRRSVARRLSSKGQQSVSSPARSPTSLAKYYGGLSRERPRRKRATRVRFLAGRRRPPEQAPQIRPFFSGSTPLHVEVGDGLFRDDHRRQ